MEFTKWRLRNGEDFPSCVTVKLLPSTIAKVMHLINSGQADQLFLDTCPMIEEGIREPDEEYCRIGGCWCTEQQAQNCHDDI